MAKDVGAKKVIFASCAPPIRYSNVYGIDMPSRTELVAYDRSEDDIAAYLGADLVVYQTLPDLIHSVTQLNPSLNRFDCSVFDGVYVTGHVEEAYLQHLERLRSDNAKVKEISMGGSGGMVTVPSTKVNSLANGQTNGTIDGRRRAMSNGCEPINGVMNGMGKPLQQQLMETQNGLSDGCSGPMNGSDDTMGLHNSWSIIAPVNEKNKVVS